MRTLLGVVVGLCWGVAGFAQPKPSPVFVGDQYLLAFWDGDAWLAADQASPSPLAIRWVSPTMVLGTATATYQPDSSAEEPAGCDVFPYRLDGAHRAQVGLGGTWNPLPRPVTWLANQSEVYVQAARAIAGSNGIPAAATVTLDALVRTDVDGDGVLEVLLASTGTYQQPNSPTQHRWSFVALRRVLGGAVQTQLLQQLFIAQDVPPDAEAIQFPALHTKFRLSHVVDVTGDGVLEVLLEETSYEYQGYLLLQQSGAGTYQVVAKAGCGM